MPVEWFEGFRFSVWAVHCERVSSVCSDAGLREGVGSNRSIPEELFQSLLSASALIFLSLLFGSCFFALGECSIPCFLSVFSLSFFGNKFGESLGGSQAPLSFWEVPGLPRKFPKLPRKFPDFPGGQPLSLGSLTPSPGSQKLSLISEDFGLQGQTRHQRLQSPCEPHPLRSELENENDTAKRGM